MIHLKTQWGFGDCVFARGIVAPLSRREQLTLETPWPGLFNDLPLEFIRPRTTPALRTQAEKIEASAGLYRQGVPPAASEVRKIYYHPQNLDPIVEQMLRTVPEVTAAELDFRLYPSTRWGSPMFPKPSGWESLAGVPWGRQILLVRRPSFRGEWQQALRDPPRGTFAAAVGSVRSELNNPFMIEVGYFKEREEWPAEDELDPPADLDLTRGELPLEAIAYLCQRAAAVVCTSSFMLPLAMASGGNVVAVFNSVSERDTPERLCGPQLRAASNGFRAIFGTES